MCYKCFIAEHVTYDQSHTFTDRMVLAVLTLVAEGGVLGWVASNGISPVSDVEKLSMQAASGPKVCITVNP